MKTYTDPREFWKDTVVAHLEAYLPVMPIEKLDGLATDWQAGTCFVLTLEKGANGKVATMGMRIERERGSLEQAETMAPDSKQRKKHARRRPA